MKFKITMFFTFLIITGCATGPSYKTPPITIDATKISNYWLPKEAIKESDIVAFSGPGMGCKGVYLEAPKAQESSYIDLRISIDSNGKKYEQEIVGSSKDVNLDAAKFAMMIGLLPVSQYVPSPQNQANQPIITITRLYLISDSLACKNKKM